MKTELNMNAVRMLAKRLRILPAGVPVVVVKAPSLSRLRIAAFSSVLRETVSMPVESGVRERYFPFTESSRDLITQTKVSMGAEDETEGVEDVSETDGMGAELESDDTEIGFETEAEFDDDACDDADWDTEGEGNTTRDECELGDETVPRADEGDVACEEEAA